MKIKGKLLAAAIALMGLTAAGAVTGTMAWFTASNTVSIKNIYMQAEAEEGIVIAKYEETHTNDSWGDSATAATSGDGQKFIPTSTHDFSKWYHGNASNVNASTATSIRELTLTEAQGVNKPASTDELKDKNVFLLNSFYIQSVVQSPIQAQYIYMTDFSLVNGTQALSKSLRVGIKDVKTSTVTILGPIVNFTANYNVGGTITNGVRSDAIATTAVAAPTTNKVWLTGDTAQDIGGYTAAGTNAWEFKVYAWFEGEDSACKSANIVTELEKITISFKLGNSSTKA